MSGKGHVCKSLPKMRDVNFSTEFYAGIKLYSVQEFKLCLRIESVWSSLVLTGITESTLQTEMWASNRIFRSATGASVFRMSTVNFINLRFPQQ
jgi:hypothetical protein